MDARAIDILFRTYWSSAGWRRDEERSVSPEDFAYARRAGVMFDPVLISHQDLVRKAIAVQDNISREAIANGFLASLSARRVYLRSALGSYAVLRHFPPHEFSIIDLRCATCGTYVRTTDLIDLNILNFERLKWGGVRHLDPVYATFDCGQFAHLPYPTPTRADVEILHALLHTIASVPPRTTAAELQKHLTRVLPSNKSERDILVGILGLCGILATPGHPSFFQRFIPQAERAEPSRAYCEMPYPACWWKGSDGIDREALAFWFGHVLG